jgi:hypothetical protein
MMSLSHIVAQPFSKAIQGVIFHAGYEEDTGCDGVERYGGTMNA